MVRNEGGEESISPSSAITQQTRFRTSSPAYHRWQGVSVGESKSPLLMLPHSRQIMGPVLPCFSPQGWLPIPLPSVLLCGPSEVQDRPSCSHDPTGANFLCLPSMAREKGRGRESLPHRCHCIADMRQGWLSHTHALVPGSTATPTSRANSSVLPR